VIALNKSDLRSAVETGCLEKALLPGEKMISVSAKTDAGLAELGQALIESVQKSGAWTEQTLVITQVRHQEALNTAVQALDAALDASPRTAFEECVAAELKKAIDSLGEIVGETYTDDLLDRIFGQFCIGK